MNWGAAIAAAKGLSFFSKFGGALSLIPGVGPLWSAVEAVFSFVCTAVAYVFNAFKECILHPVTLVALGLTLVGGIVVGMRMDAVFIERANMKFDAYKQHTQVAINVEKSKADAAIKARDDAERLARQTSSAPPTTPPGKCAPAGKLRGYRAPAAPGFLGITGLPGFQ